MTIGIVLTGCNDGEYRRVPDGMVHLYLAQPMDVVSFPQFDYPLPIEPVSDTTIKYRHVQFHWNDVTMGYWVPLNDETRKFTDDAQFRQWVMRHLTDHYIKTVKDTAK